MMFFWRGSGILVLIFLFACAWITSFSFEDTRLGNGVFMGWTMIWTSIPTALLFLFLKGSERDDENDGEETENNEIEKPVSHWSHSFMFIPVAIWPAILLGLGLYLIMG